jgi:hypothetical protein
MVTVTFGTEAPVASVTVPSRVALTACPNVKCEELRIKIVAKQMNILWRIM